MPVKTVKNLLSSHKEVTAAAVLLLVAAVGAAWYFQQAQTGMPAAGQVSLPPIELDTPLQGLDDIDAGAVDFGSLDVFSGTSFSVADVGSKELAGLPTPAPRSQRTPTGTGRASADICANFKDVPSCSYVPQQYRQYCKQCYPDK